MSHLDPSSLARYNSLIDPHLQSYFSSERIQSHLKHAGLVSGRGEVISEAEYRTRLARREHKKHVRHMLAENIVSRAIDMERTRQADMKRQFEMVAKGALVNNIKQSRRRSGTLSGLMTCSADMGLLAIDSAWSPTRPKSANHQNEIFNEQSRIPRAQSAHLDGDHSVKYPSKLRHRRPHRSLQRFKSTNINRSSTKHSRSPVKYPDSSSPSCQITMAYYGPKMKVDYDHLVFEPIDEILVMQQHCGGENIIVYKENLKPGAEFTFDSRRHSDYPFGLSFYVKGFIDSRISTCCEYKHRHGVRLGGDRGHFAIKSVQGSKPCIKCQFEKQARLKRYAKTPKEKDDQSKKPITIPISVSDEPKLKQTPIQIPVRHTSISNDNYSEDFDGSDKPKQSGRDKSSVDSSTDRSYTTNERKLKDSTPKVPPGTSTIGRKKSSRKLSSASDETPKEKSRKKTWRIIFHSSNIPTGKNILVKFSLLANDRKDETETNEINMKQFTEDSKSPKQYPFSTKFKNIGKPEQIRLKINTTENDDDSDDDEEIRWHLDHIELIDRKTQSHLIFPCKQWIRPTEEKILQISQESSRSERSSTSTNSSRPSSSNNKDRRVSPKLERKAKTSSRSSISPNTSKQLQTKSNSTHRFSPDNQSNQSQKSTPRNDIHNQENKTRYRVTIYPSNHDDGEFNPARNSKIFLRLNNQTKETNLINKTDQSCPTFEPNEKQTFELDLIENLNEKPNKLTIGYINSDIATTKWKLEKIILTNLETGDESIFPCKETLIRNESDFRAEKTFEIQSEESDDQITPRNQKIHSPKSDHEEQQIQSSEKQHLQSSEKPQTQPSEEPPIQTSERPQAQSPEKSQVQSLEKSQTQSSEKLPIQTSEKPQVQTSEKQQTQTSEKPQIQPSEQQQIQSSEKQQTQPSEKPQVNGSTKQKSPSFQSMNDEEADYRKIFKQLDPDNEYDLGSPPHSPISRPKTRRGPHDEIEQRNTNQPVDPLVGLDDLADQTARSNDQHNQSSVPSATTDNAEDQFRKLYPPDDDDDTN